ncbi:MAG: PP0621 family protein [Diaphorobacter nitroreducens]|uniref:PP0621 family protein n=1 Tax=Diaphorobacter nitroreducens TaxID=164759 RepID=UPI0000DCDBFD|nr:conserved hypothetical protein [Acidovorax sp. JS42]
MKYLVLFAVLAVVYAVWRAQRRASAPRQGNTQRPSIAPPQDMVRCAHCGVHLPRGDAVPKGAHMYCSTAHRDRGPA